MAALHPATRLALEVRDLLDAIDRGHFGTDLRIGPPGDRVESAYVASLRQALGDYEATDRALVSHAHKRGAEIADAYPLSHKDAA